MLQFKEVCVDNRSEVEALQLFPEQSGYIESVAECMAEADAFSQWHPIGIYADNILIGFAMYGYFNDTSPSGQLWLDRFLIDMHYQGMGYGKAAVLALLEKLRREYDADKVYLSVYDVNKTAISLYEHAGFHFTGTYDTNGEKIMIYEYPPMA